MGAGRVARFLINLAKRLDPSSPVEVVMANDRVGLFFRGVSERGMVMTLDIDEDRKVCRIDAQLNPDKLKHLQPET